LARVRWGKVGGGNDGGKVFQNIGAATVVAAIVLGLSYCSELPKQRFAQSVIDQVKVIPGARQIASFQSGDLTSPVSWFWPPTTRLIYARPDIAAPDTRFYIMSFGYHDAPALWLASMDCAVHKEAATYFPAEKGDQGEPGEPARNILGDPVKAPNGAPFLRHDTPYQPTPDQIHALCDTDWTAERKAAAAR